MDTAVEDVISKVRPKVRGILRTRHIYYISGMIMQYKAHVLPIAEMNNGAIYHATNTVLKRLDCTYYSFLRELEIDASSAFTNHNLAPLELRRDIGMLGFLHKIVLGECHSGIAALFPFASTSAYLHEGRHNKQFQVQWDKCKFQKMLFGRSVFEIFEI